MTDLEVRQALGSRIRYLREEAGMSCETLGAEFGMAGSTVSSWERGDRTLYADRRLFALAGALGISAGYLIDLDRPLD